MSIEKDTYLTIESPSEAIFKDRGSKFFGYAFPVSNEEEIKEHLQQLKKLHPSSRHVCYAFRINPMNEYWRANDDGEPSSSAGKPILGQLRSMELQNTLVAVVRYFGGTLLGVPGLINAYKTAAYEALNGATKIEKTITETIELKVGYEKMGDVMKFAKDSGFEYDSPIMQDDFTLRIHIPAGKSQEMRSKFMEESWMNLD
jgi:uncharacterized YigZ family protein